MPRHTLAAARAATGPLPKMPMAEYSSKAKVMKLALAINQLVNVDGPAAVHLAKWHLIHADQDIPVSDLVHALRAQHGAVPGTTAAHVESLTGGAWYHDLWSRTKQLASGVVNKWAPNGVTEKLLSYAPALIEKASTVAQAKVSDKLSKLREASAARKKAAEEAARAAEEAAKAEAKVDKADDAEEAAEIAALQAEEAAAGSAGGASVGGGRRRYGGGRARSLTELINRRGGSADNFGGASVGGSFIGDLSRLGGGRSVRRMMSGMSM